MRKAVLLLLLLAVTGAAQNMRAQDTAPSNADREKKLPTLIGKTLYNCYGANFNELQVPGPTDEDQSPRVGRPARNLSLLTPLEVTDVFSKYGELTHVYTVVLSLKRPDGRRLGLVGHMRETGPLLEGDQLLENLVHEGTMNREWDLFTKIPDWSADDLESIRMNAVMPGMYQQQFQCVKGYPDTINKFGHGDEQDIYGRMPGSSVIYYFKDGKYTDEQEFDGTR
jgi:hypothetical protein